MHIFLSAEIFIETNFIRFSNNNSNVLSSNSSDVILHCFLINVSLQDNSFALQTFLRCNVTHLLGVCDVRWKFPTLFMIIINRMKLFYHRFHAHLISSYLFCYFSKTHLFNVAFVCLWPIKTDPNKTLTLFLLFILECFMLNLCRTNLVRLVRVQYEFECVYVCYNISLIYTNMFKASLGTCLCMPKNISILK